MKPQDLRIGNYVRIKGDKMAQVVGILDDRIKVIYRLGKIARLFVEFFKYSEIEPVLIRGVYDKLPYLKDLEYTEHSKWYAYRYKGIPIGYLHELQNIHHALTGNEIEIEI